MNEDQNGITLIRHEPVINEQDPWHNDVLDRKSEAQFFTNLVRNQESPLVIGLHASWGTGKTFLLRRWQQDLVNEGFQTIYYNAWEDDFTDDPLTAIIGQISESINYAPYDEVIGNIERSVIPLLARIPLGMLNKISGIDYVSVIDEIGQNALKDYKDQHKYKEDLKFYLSQLSNIVKQENDTPLVFIVDELDRCRPTFSIELLERVKHVFNIDNIVFVFGINRSELCASLRSVYGEIDAEVYLRRFFDMDFVLSEPLPVPYCKHLIEEYNLQGFFRDHGLSSDWFEEFFPFLCQCFGFSLRDMEYCVRTIASIKLRIKEREGVQAVLLSVLTVLRLADRQLYYGYIYGNRKASEVIDRIDNNANRYELDQSSDRMLNHLEAFLYLTDERTNGGRGDISVSVHELRVLNQALESEERLPPSLHLSKYTRESSTDRIQELLEVITQISGRYEFREYSLTRKNILFISGLIELHLPVIT